MQITLFPTTVRLVFGLVDVLARYTDGLQERQFPSDEGGYYTARPDWEYPLPEHARANALHRTFFIMVTEHLRIPILASHHDAEASEAQGEPESAAIWLDLNCPMRHGRPQVTIEWDVPALTGYVVELVQHLMYHAGVRRADLSDRDTLYALWAVVPSAEWPDFEAMFGKLPWALPVTDQAEELGSQAADGLDASVAALTQPEAELHRSGDGGTRPATVTNGRMGDLQDDEGSLSEPTALEPWEQIRDRLWDREALRLWCKGKTASAIAAQLHVAPKTVNNRIFELRREHGSEIVPHHKSRG